MSSDREAELAASLSTLRQRLDAAAGAAGRDVGEIQLLPVTKFFPASDVISLIQFGCREFGESREQEASAKVAEISAAFPAESVRWHMIGRIQRKKARAVARWAHAAHSVDGAALVQALDRGAVQALADGVRDERLRVYVQVSLDGDAERGGLDVRRPEVVDGVCDAVQSADGLDLVGLMAIPPLAEDPERAFVRLEAELGRVQARYRQRLGLSAGMSGDLETAVKHGSTCVRVGTALMGERPLTSPGVVTPVTSTSQTTRHKSSEGSPE